MFNEKIYKAIKEFQTRYGFKADIPKHLSAASMLNGMLSDIQMQLNNHNIYVIIDEYDHFANDLLSFRYQEFTNVMGSDGYVRAFYEELKNGTQKGIGRIFVTGVSPISLDSMTSGLGAAHPWCNISTNLSLDSEYHEMMGFTSDEVSSLINIVKKINDPEKVLCEMKQYYDGYYFAEDAKHHLFALRTFGAILIWYCITWITINDMEKSQKKL